ncbi:MAG: TRL-like family protein [Aestuariibaculum sp.]
MLKNVKKVAVLAIAAVMMSSCALTLPVNATSNSVGSKVGTAKATGYLSMLFFDQDASIKTAAKNGGISKISTVDIKHTSILGLIVTYETIVTGE